ncbi:MAG: hydrogenase formation protein HypD [Treponema sp.]|jgi:hydrogenase expression/formation protein HypD|nr:hydrogenase formation protein HypD [Treponema sp.]
MPNKTEQLKSVIRQYSGRKLRIMEVCGTHTHEIFRLGIRSLLPDTIELISGPGCPVCVTPVDYIDEAVYLALEKNVTICTFGDLIRVPGTTKSLGGARSDGANVMIVYSPLDALDYARQHPETEVVFLAIGFETTTPGSCIAVRNAAEAGITNFSLLTANKTMYNAYLSLKGSCDAFLYPGHVSTMTGTKIYETLRDAEGISGVVTGFTALEIMTALAVIIRESAGNKPFFVNCYPRVVTETGSIQAQKLVADLMESCDAVWRGLGTIKGSGLQLNDRYRDYDARLKFSIPVMEGKNNPACRCGEVLLGNCRPYDCPLFGKNCTPEHPVGACMVSSEGACSAYYKYGDLQWKK